MNLLATLPIMCPTPPTPHPRELQLQLVGIGALRLASKFEEIYPVDVEELVRR